MKKASVTAACILVLCSCASPPGGVMNKVMVDFGLREKPEGYATGADKVMERLPQVGQVELKRLNIKNREGEIQFEEGGGLTGKYYKEVKVYENAYPIDAQAVSRGQAESRGFVGFIDYSYRLHQSERRNTRAEAAALDASIPTDVRGRESYRYTFTQAGTWDGTDGQSVRR